MARKKRTIYKQFGLFDAGVNVEAHQPDRMIEPNARQTDPATAHQAAEFAKLRAGTHRALAYKLLAKAYPDGLTDFELAARTGLQQTSIGKRRGELMQMGLVVDSTMRRRAPSGALAIVWCVVYSKYLTYADYLKSQTQATGVVAANRKPRRK